jgi:hypothetical protein
MSLIGVLMGGLRMLLRTLGMLLALRVIALAMVFGGGTMRLGGVFVMFSCLVVFVSCHLWAPWFSAPSRHQTAEAAIVPFDYD